METINGVSFEEYAAASANIAQGMAEETVLEILGLEKPVFDETFEKWGVRLGELMTEDMKYAQIFGDIFANPKVGRFAEASTPVVEIEDLLKIVPNLDEYLDIFHQISVGNKYGVDPQTIIQSRGLDVGKWAQVGMHYGKEINENLNDNNPNYVDFFQYFTNLEKEKEQKWEDYYKDYGVDISGDIEF